MMYVFLIGSIDITDGIQGKRGPRTNTRLFACSTSPGIKPCSALSTSSSHLGALECTVPTNPNGLERTARREQRVICYCRGRMRQEATTRAVICAHDVRIGRNEIRWALSSTLGTNTKPSPQAQNHGRICAPFRPAPSTPFVLAPAACQESSLPAQWQWTGICVGVGEIHQIYQRTSRPAR